MNKHSRLHEDWYALRRTEDAGKREQEASDSKSNHWWFEISNLLVSNLSDPKTNRIESTVELIRTLLIIIKKNVSG